MSTLKVANIQDTSGSNSSTPAEVSQGRAKAWCYWDSTGSGTIVDDFNISSLTDLGTGEWKLTFSSNMPNANYGVVCGLAVSTPSGFSGNCLANAIDWNVANTTIETFVNSSGGGSATDAGRNMAVVFGD